jgi:FO synthase
VRQRSTTYREPVARLEPAVAARPRLLPLTSA